MISLEQILIQYPEHLRGFRSSILKEYLQYKILKSIFNSPHANKLAFLGGTALRIVYGSTRFSEDLDFDNFDLSEAEFTDLSGVIQSDLTSEGLEVEISTVTRNAYRIKIRIPKLLFDTGLSPLHDQKVLIQVDTVPQHFPYEPEKPLLNKCDVFTQINVVPKDLLFAQKIYAAVNRKRAMGRDFFDIIFLHGRGAKPNFAYLKKNIRIDQQADLKKYLLEKTSHLDFEALSRDVEPLLFYPEDRQKVLLFREYVEQNF